MVMTIQIRNFSTALNIDEPRRDSLTCFISSLLYRALLCSALRLLSYCPHSCFDCLHHRHQGSKGRHRRKPSEPAHGESGDPETGGWLGCSLRIAFLIT